MKFLYKEMYHLQNGTETNGAVLLDDGSTVYFTTYDIYTNGVRNLWTVFERRH